MGTAKGSEPLLLRKVVGGGRETHQEMHKENTSPNLLGGKTRGADFPNFLQPAGLKDSSFKGLQAWLG